MGRLTWIIHVECNHKGLYKSKAEGSKSDRERDRQTEKEEAEVRTL